MIYNTSVLLDGPKDEKGTQNRSGLDNRHGKLLIDNALLFTYLGNS